MKVMYPAVLSEENGLYKIIFPDLPGCQTEGKTVEEVKENASLALSGYILVKGTVGEKINLPSSLSEISCKPDEEKIHISFEI